MEQDRPDILKKILLRKREEISERTRLNDIDALKKQMEQAEPVRGFISSIEKTIASGKPAVIAEIKKASPSKGILRENFDPVAIAKTYQDNGATCISVLTDSDYFQGSEDYLKQARAACKLPVIRKDFIIDPYQVYEARAINADCILLIVAALDDDILKELLAIAHSLDMDALIEVHDKNELARALKCGARLIGINNRSLHTFETSLQTTLSMLNEVPDNKILVTESGILTTEDVSLMQENGVHAFLVGEAFMRADDPGEKLKELFR
jgi:indole-3-glycerol phosphate synthase